MPTEDSSKLPWIQFALGVRDAITDVLDDEVGGTPEEVLAANEPNASGYEDAPMSQGYLAGIAILRAAVETIGRK